MEKQYISDYDVRLATLAKMGGDASKNYASVYDIDIEILKLTGQGGGGGTTPEQVRAIVEEYNYTTMADVEAKNYMTQKKLSLNGDATAIVDEEGNTLTYEQVKVLVDNKALFVYMLVDNAFYIPCGDMVIPSGHNAVEFSSAFIVNDTPNLARIIIDTENEVIYEQYVLADRDWVEERIAEIPVGGATIDDNNISTETTFSSARMEDDSIKAYGKKQAQRMAVRIPFDFIQEAVNATEYKKRTNYLQPDTNINLTIHNEVFARPNLGSVTVGEYSSNAVFWHCQICLNNNGTLSFDTIPGFDIDGNPFDAIMDLYAMGDLTSEDKQWAGIISTYKNAEGEQVIETNIDGSGDFYNEGMFARPSYGRISFSEWGQLIGGWSQDAWTKWINGENIELQQVEPTFMIFCMHDYRSWYTDDSFAYKLGLRKENGYGILLKTQPESISITPEMLEGFDVEFVGTGYLKLSDMGTNVYPTDSDDFAHTALPKWDARGLITGYGPSKFDLVGLGINGGGPDGEGQEHILPIWSFSNFGFYEPTPELGSIYAPTTPGTAGQILQSTGDGAPVWVNNPGGGSLNVLTFDDLEEVGGGSYIIYTQDETRSRKQVSFDEMLELIENPANIVRIKDRDGYLLDGRVSRNYYGKYITFSGTSRNIIVNYTTDGAGSGLYVKNYGWYFDWSYLNGYVTTVQLTQAEYDALSTKDDHTLYIITDAE